MLARLVLLKLRILPPFPPSAHDTLIHPDGIVVLAESVKASTQDVERDAALIFYRDAAGYRLRVHFSPKLYVEFRWMTRSPVRTFDQDIVDTGELRVFENGKEQFSGPYAGSLKVWCREGAIDAIGIEVADLWVNLAGPTLPQVLGSHIQTRA